MGIYYVGIYPYSDNYLAHHGIKGMKWGVRRYQNEDGSLTAAGKKRYYGKVDRIQKDIDSFKGLEGGIKTKGGRTVLTSKDVQDHVRGLELVRDRERARGDGLREKDALRGRSRSEKLAAQNYQRYSKENLPFQGVIRHYVNNAKYWKNSISEIKNLPVAYRGKEFAEAILDQPIILSGFTGTSEVTLRDRLTGKSYEWY